MCVIQRPMDQISLKVDSFLMTWKCLASRYEISLLLYEIFIIISYVVVVVVSR